MPRARAALALALAGLWLLSGSGCPSEDRPPTQIVDDMFLRDRADGAADADTDGAQDGGPADIVAIPEFVHGGGPSIEILEPANDSLYAVDGTIDVRARVLARDGVAVERTTVRAYLGDAPNIRQAPLVLGTEENIFEGTIGTEGFPAGSYPLRVYATDVDGRPEYAEVNVVVAEGPLITVVRPERGESVRDQLIVEFTATGRGAAIDPKSVTAQSLSQGIPLVSEAVDEQTTRYRGSIDLTKISSSDGEQALTLVAADVDGLTTRIVVSYRIDRTGPDIDILVPAPAELYGSLINIQVMVSDPTGVQEGSVVAQLTNGGEPISGTNGLVIPPIVLENQGGGLYTAVFDSRTIPTHIQLPSIVVVARDLLGNAADNGHEFALDTLPPIIDLDPPPDMRLSHPLCGISYPFDPVGVTAVNDLGVPSVMTDTDPEPMPTLVAQLFHAVADIEDQANAGPGARFGLQAGVDPRTTKLYILDDTSKPLAVDTDGDGICDAINPEVIPVTGEPPQPGRALELDLESVRARGTTLYPACSNPLPTLCATTNLTVALADNGGQRALWALRPVVEDSFLCVGQDVDTGNNIQEGWACIAAAASDNLGNQGVSAPLRVCICRSGQTCPACSFLPDASSAPDCTGTALPNQPVTHQPCTPIRFSPGRIYIDPSVNPAVDQEAGDGG